MSVNTSRTFQIRKAGSETLRHVETSLAEVWSHPARWSEKVSDRLSISHTVTVSMY